jgi:hypothetical protein
VGRAPSIFGALAVGAAMFVGCGKDRPPGQGDGTGPTPGGGANAFAVDGGGLKPPGCGVKPDGTSCDCVDTPLFLDPPTMYFVLDRSGSMGVGDKWTQIRIVVGKIMRSIGPRARFGATMFPGNTDSCSAGVEVMSVRDGDPPSSTVDGPTTSALLAATRVEPNGGTSTAATLVDVKASLARPTGHAFVILATDGAPNCDKQATCGVDQCQLNMEQVPGCTKDGPDNCCQDRPDMCNDRGPTLAAIEALKAAGIPVYVIGLPGADFYASLLDEMAVAGGTALPTSPKYLAVNAASEAAMLAALRRVAAQITGTCSFELKQAPSDYGQINVYVDDSAVPYEPVDGWSISGKTVTLLGKTCSRVTSGDALNVRIISGCPRVEPR